MENTFTSKEGISVFRTDTNLRNSWRGITVKGRRTELIGFGVSLRSSREGFGNSSEQMCRGDDLKSTKVLIRSCHRSSTRHL